VAQLASVLASGAAGTAACRWAMYQVPPRMAAVISAVAPTMMAESFHML
jgi:hypothetical protein